MTGTGESDSVKPERLTLATRWISGVLGLGIVGSGIAAVFVKNNNGGSAVLIGAGAVFLLMAVTGHGVRSFKIGSSEVVMDAVDRAREQKRQGDVEGAMDTIESLIEEPISTTPQHLRGSIDSVSTVSGVLTTPTAGPAYEQAVLNALTEAVWQWGAVLQDVRPSSRRFDWILRVDGLNLAVEVRSGDKINAQAFAWSMETYVQTADITIGGLLVIVNASPNSSSLAEIQSQLSQVLGLPHSTLAWRAANESGVLKRAVIDLLDQVRNFEPKLIKPRDARPEETS